MKNKKKWSLLISLSIIISSISALEVQGRYLGDIEIGINQGFPVLIQDNGELFGMNENVVTTSTGFNIGYSYKINSSIGIGGNFVFEWGYSTIVNQVLYQNGVRADSKGIHCPFFFKFGPLIKITGIPEKMYFSIKPEFIFGYEGLHNELVSVNDGIVVKTFAKVPFQFGIGVGLKADYFFNKWVGINIGIDVEWISLSEEGSIYSKASDGTAMNQKGPKDQLFASDMLRNIMPKIGITFKF